ncbi:MAG: hypothetical protein ACOC90_04685, partial [Bacteroidota bacterium]
TFILPAAGVGAPHRRDRVWFVGYCSGTGSGNNGVATNTTNCRSGGRQGEQCVSEPSRGLQPEECTWGEFWGEAKGCGGEQLATNTERIRMEGSGTNRKQESQAQAGSNVFGCNGSRDFWKDWPTQSPVCGRNDGVSNKLDGITFSKWRNESIKGFGNAIVPQIALQIFKAIQQYEEMGEG